MTKVKFKTSTSYDIPYNT